jgi:hypothetical protein
MTRPTHDNTAGEPHCLADDGLDPLFTDDLLYALAGALPAPGQETDRQKKRRRAAAIVALRSFDAREPVEAMLATHAVLAHHHAMECYRRAASTGGAAVFDAGLLDAAAALSRTMGSTLLTLQQLQQAPVDPDESSAP